MRKKLQLLFLLLLAAPIGLLAQGTTWETATEIKNGNTATGTLSSSVTEQWFKVVIAENGTAKFNVKAVSGDLGLNYTTMYALDASGKLQSRGNVWSNSELTVKSCAKGTYYVQVKQNGGQGGYSIEYNFTPMSASYANDSEPNDTYQEAQSININGTVTGHLGYGYWDDTDAVDWYKVQVPENGTLTITMTAHGDLGLNYTTVYALGADNDVHSRGEVWAGSEKSPSVCTVKSCAKGTYYIRVKHNGGQGGYTLDCQFTPMSASYANDSEPNDTYQEAQSININGTVTGHLGYGYWDDTDAVDWYKVQVPENGTLTITMTAHGDLGLNYTTVYALGADNDVHSRGEVWAGSEKSPSVCTVKSCAKGTYYIRVKHNGGQGGYTLDCKFTPMSASYADDVEPNNSWDTAKYQKRGSTITGHLGYKYWDDTDAVDWHYLTVPRDGTITLTVEAHGDLGLNYTTVYSKNAAGELKNRSSVWSNGTITVPNAAPGNYYVEVKHNGGQGAYSLQYKFDQNPYATDAELNDDMASALTLKKGATVAGHLGYNYFDDTDGVDYYKFTTTTTSDVTFTYQVQETLGLGYVTLYNEEGESIKDVWGQNGGTHSNTLTKNELGAGTYYLAVKRNSGQGYYLLTFGSTLGEVEQLDPLPAETDGEPISIGSALVAGFSSNYNLDFEPLKSKGVSAWIATGFNDGNVLLSRVYQVPAGEGVYVKADKAGDYEIPYTSKEPFYVNMFVGVPNGATVDMYEDFWGETYLTLSLAMSKTTGKPGFFPNTKEKTYGKNKMYLHMPARLLPEYAQTRISDFSLGIIFEDEETTGISEASPLNDKGQMENDKRGEIYDLQGRRVVGQPTKSGLYIKNGRKVMIK